jgi:flagellin
MKNVGTDQNRASARLSSGFRITSAADDAAGLAISESMRAQIRGLDQASRNTQDGQALVQTAEGGLQEIQNMMQRIRELAVQAANDTNTHENRAEHIALEVWQLNREIEEISNRVEFNGMQILNSLNPQSIFGSDTLGGGMRFQVGANQNQLMRLRLDLNELQSQVPYNISDNGAITHVGGPSRLSVFQAIVGSLNHVALAMEQRSGVNPILGTTHTYVEGALDISQMIGLADHYVNLVSNMRAELGAVMNRMEFTMRSLDISGENLSDAESRVRNTDMAREMMRFTMANVLQQASVSMLSQANQLPNNLLQLLR